MPVDAATSKPDVQWGYVRDVKEAMLQPVGVACVSACVCGTRAVVSVLAVQSDCAHDGKGACGVRVCGIQPVPAYMQQAVPA